MTKFKFIPIETLLEMSENNEDFKLIEVLPEEGFKKGHIPGAINMPLDKLEMLAKERLPKDNLIERSAEGVASNTRSVPIVVYCASYSCQASSKGARMLMEMGYENVLDFKAGKKGWVAAGLELAL